MNKTGEYIALLRKKRGLTQVALGEIIGVSPKTISKWETGDGLPEVSILPSLALSLKTTVDALLNGAPLSIGYLVKSLGAKEDIEKVKYSVVSIISLLFALKSLSYFFAYLVSTDLYFANGGWSDTENMYTSFSYIALFLVLMLISKMIYNSYRSNNLIKQEGHNIIDASFKTMWGVPPIFVITNFIILMFTNIIGSNSILILIPMMITLIRGIRIFKKAKSKQIIV